MKHVYFRPWVGDNYRDCSGLFDKRILILGESHYEWGGAKPEDLGPELTVACIQGHCEGDNSRFWTMTLNLVSGQEGSHGSADRTKFWHSVCFANFVQEIVGQGSRIPPTEAMWEGGRRAFPELLEALQPDLLVVFGERLWDNLPQNTTDGPVLESAVDGFETTYYYPHAGGNVLACFVKHPSGQGAGHIFSAGIQEAIDKAPTP